MDEKVTTVLETGPRAFDPDLPKDVRDEIANSTAFIPFKQALTRVAQEQARLVNLAIRAQGRENRESEYKATDGLGLPYARIPLIAIDLAKAWYGEECWQDKWFMERFLDDYPELRLKVTRGTRGQEYAGNGR